MMGRLKSEQGQLFYQFIPRDMQPGPATAVRFAGSGDGVRPRPGSTPGRPSKSVGGTGLLDCLREHILAVT